ncbi:MAG: Crp/Fnr family transcriptional regulator [Gammaproteobacteria bacterium]|nr:Crp/Fnr family transcriptional regulator [Gammaproteobacteria bacterium]
MATKQHIKRLEEILGRLPGEMASVLIEYAEFLDHRHGRDPLPQDPLAIPRPEQESVVQAMKRLTNTYPMINTEMLLHKAGDLMGQHLMQARPAPEVIDDLEALFRQYYEQNTLG